MREPYLEPEPVPLLEPDEPDPMLPELPDDPVVPAPDELEPLGEPLAPELVSPARRSQPTAVKLRAARTNKTFDVVLIAFILVPFTKS